MAASRKTASTLPAASTIKAAKTAGVTRTVKPTGKPTGKPAGRSGGTVDAPGKTHRKPLASAKGVKHSDLTVSKIKDAETMRRGHRRG